MRDTVRVNIEKLKADMQAMGVSGVRLSKAMGKSDNYFANVIKAHVVERSTLEGIEC